MAPSTGTTSIAVDPSWEDCCAFISTQEVTAVPISAPALVPDFEGLTPQQASQARALFAQYDSMFSRGDGDLGCTCLITHEIPLLDDAPVRQP